MNNFSTAARPYARAVFEYAQQHNELDQWSAMLAFLSVVAAHTEVKRLIESPKLNHAERARLLLDICGSKLTDKAGNLLKLLAENRRLAIIPAVAEQYAEYRALAENQIEATVVSAQTISEEELARIQLALEKRFGKHVTLKTEINKGLIGGAIIKAGDTVIDGSLKARIDKLAVQMLS